VPLTTFDALEEPVHPVKVAMSVSFVALPLPRESAGLAVKVPDREHVIGPLVLWLDEWLAPAVPVASERRIETAAATAVARPALRHVVMAVYLPDRKSVRGLGISSGMPRVPYL